MAVYGLSLGCFSANPVPPSTSLLLVRYQTWGKAIVTTHKQKATDAFVFLRQYADDHLEELLRPRRLVVKQARKKKKKGKSRRR